MGTLATITGELYQCHGSMIFNGVQTIASKENYHPGNCPGQLPPRQLPPRNIVPPRIIAPWMIAPGLSLPDNYPKDNCPLKIYAWKMLPRKISFWMICRLHNCPSDKWPQGKLPSRKIDPRISYIRDIFSQRIRNCSTLTDSCFLLFSFFVV